MQLLAVWRKEWHVTVARGNEQVRTEYTSNLQLIDRVFLLGDIVARVADQLGQTGEIAPR